MSILQMGSPTRHCLTMDTLTITEYSPVGKPNTVYEMKKYFF